MLAAQPFASDAFRGGADREAAPGHSGGLPLNHPAYSGWRIGDFLGGRGLLGLIRTPVDAVASARGAAAWRAVHEDVVQGMRRAGPTPGSTQFTNGLGSGFINEFNDMGRDAVAQGRQIARDPIGSTLAFDRSAALQTFPWIDPLASAQQNLAAGRQMLRDGHDLVDGYKAAARIGTLPHFVGDQLGNVGALGALTLATRGLGEVGGFGLRRAGRLLTRPLETRALVPAEPPALVSATKIPTIGGRKPRNSQFAGRVHPSGVRFTEQGFPDFSPHSRMQIEVENLTGHTRRDRQLANRLAGYPKTPQGHTWHHVEDMKTMQLVPKKLHKATPHTGGAAIIRNGGFDR